MYTEERKCDNNWNKGDRFQSFRKSKILYLFLRRKSVYINIYRIECEIEDVLSVNFQVH